MTKQTLSEWAVSKLLEHLDDYAVDNASRPWDARDDAGWEHLDKEDDE